jgi:hypothetical protein
MRSEGYVERLIRETPTPQAESLTDRAGGWKLSDPYHGHEKERFDAKPPGHGGFVTYRQTAPPRQLPTVEHLGAENATRCPEP